MNQIYFEAKREELLKRIGMTKSEFARQMGIRKQNVKALFKTKNLETIYKAAGVMGVPFELLVGYVEEPDLGEIPIMPDDDEDIIVNEGNNNLTFDSLIGRINLIQDALQAQAAHAVNLFLTARNWLVGYYIVEFEQHGEDRAKYGEKLLKNLANSLNRRGLGERRLYEYRLTYQVYPQLGSVVEDYLFKNGNDVILRLTSAISVASQEAWHTPPQSLFYKLPASHLIYLSNIDDDLKRAFYEQETIRNCWTYTELDRQVSSQYYERMGMSKDKKALQRLTARKVEQITPKEIIHNPVTLEFLGIRP